MLVVVALGGNALLKRGEPMTAAAQRANVRVAAQALAPIAREHQLVITHGNGPQVGLLALQAAAYMPEDAYPLDVLGAETEGSIGYMIEQELGNLLPAEVPFATILTMVEVHRDDPGFDRPTKFVGPLYKKAEADRIAKEKGWVFRKDGDQWRRVVPSPVPQHIIEIRPIRWLLDRGTIVICAGGGGIPTMFEAGSERKLVGVEAVIDKDLCSELLARELDADLFVMLTDVDAVYRDWGKATQSPIRDATPELLQEMRFAAGSMGPKVEAACHFAAATGRPAAIGSLPDLGRIIAGEAGTMVRPSGKRFTAARRPG
jgi:carbamate kinase